MPDEKTKFTVYLPKEIEEALDAFWLEDRAAKKMPRKEAKSLPQYLSWVLIQVARMRQDGRLPELTPSPKKKRR